MDVQTALVLVVAVAAAAYLARAAWRTWAGRGCKSGCGCGPKQPAQPTLIGADELLARARRGGPDGRRKMRS